MAVPDDSQIEQCLRRVVREAEKKGEDVTVKRARERTEAQLKLETGFLRRENWKQRSKDIIESAFQGEEEHESPRKQRPASAKEPNQDQSKRQNGTGKKSSEVAQEDDASSTKEKSASKSKSRSNGDEQRVGGESGHIESQKDIAPRKPEKTVPKVNGVKRKSETESSSEGESGESEEESAGKHSGPQRKKAKVDPSATSEESSGESSSGGSESSKDEEAEKEYVAAVSACRIVMLLMLNQLTAINGIADYNTTTKATRRGSHSYPTQTIQASLRPYTSRPESTCQQHRFLPV